MSRSVDRSAPFTREACVVRRFDRSVHGTAHEGQETNRYALQRSGATRCVPIDALTQGGEACDRPVKKGRQNVADEDELGH